VDGKKDGVSTEKMCADLSEYLLIACRKLEAQKQ
jgi:hypothetical protein